MVLCLLALGLGLLLLLVWACVEIGREDDESQERHR